MSIFLLCAAALLLFATLAPLSKKSYWWIRILDFPRIQIAVLSAAVFGLFFIFPISLLNASLFLQFLLLGCIAFQTSWILPYLPFAKPEVAAISKAGSINTIRLLTANVLQTNKNKQGLLKIIKECNPDIIVTLETDEVWERSLESMDGDYKHKVLCPLNNLYGMHVYSKLKLVNPEIKFLVKDGIPSIHCEIELPGCPNIQIHFLHPEPPVPQYSESSDGRDAELIVVAKSIRDLAMPCIVAGDLNDVAWSTTTRLFRKISGLLDPRVGRGVFNTFHADYPLIRWPLDHVFHSSDFSLVSVARLKKFGSDHFPLFIELGYSGTNLNGKSGLSPTSDDHALANEKIGKEDVSVKDVPGG